VPVRNPNGLLLAASVLAALALAEGAARVAGLGPAREVPDVVLRLPLQHAYLDHRVGRAELFPEDPEVRFRTDARGYIEPSRPHAAPDATVAFLGGSTTECRAVREELRFPALSAALLETRGLRVNALNAGRSAGTVHDALHVLLDRVALDSPDLALLMEAVNDAGVLARDGGYAGRGGVPVAPRDLAKWSLQLAARRLALADLFRARILPTLRMRAEPAWDASAAERPAPRAPYRARVEGFVGLARALQIEPVLVTQPLGYVDETTPPWVDAPDQDAFNAELRAAAARTGATLIDLAERVATHPDRARPGALFYDGLHVTDAGSRLYAEIVAEALADRLARIRAGRSGGALAQ
jgi:lysophospholipase L1-like esterase